MAFQDLTGKTFGRWTVLRREENRGKAVFWECSCICGKIKTVSGSHLKCGRTLSCGCLQKERAAECATKHGEHGIPEYVAWKNMISRCYNPKNDHYHLYGGRGISVYDGWRNDFSTFFEHIGKRPTQKHSVDRIEVNGNYEPGNVRWATHDVQAHNKRISKSNTTGVSGVILRGERYMARISVKSQRIYLGTFDTIEEATLARLEAERTYW